MNPAPTTPATAETFRYDPSNRTVFRESDSEAMAVLSPEGVLSFTHHSRERNYGADIRALLTAASIAFTEPGAPAVQPSAPTGTGTAGSTPTRPPAVTTTTPAVVEDDEAEEEPPRCPVAGAFTKQHLRYDWINRSDAEFARKWAGPMALTTRRMLEANADYFGNMAIDIPAFLDGQQAPGVNQPPARLEAFVRERLAKFVEANKEKLPTSEEESITTLTAFIAEIAIDPDFRALLP